MNILQDKDILEFAANQESQTVRSWNDFIDGAVKRVQAGTAVYGDPLPWFKTTDKFRFRPQEVTIWAGTNSSGKSLVLGQAALWLAPDSKILICSMEMPPEATIERMMRQASGCAKPSEKFMRETCSGLGENIWIYDQTDTVKPERIIAAIHWAARKLGIKHIIIDSMVKVVPNVEDRAAQSAFVDRLCWAAKQYKIHIHLVVHTRKGASETDQPDKYSVKGAGEIVDLADNLILVSRNIGKEKKVRENRAESADIESPDCFLRVAKHRHGEWEGTWGFWWHEESQQWVSRQGLKMPWPNPEEQFH